MDGVLLQQEIAAAVEAARAAERSRAEAAARLQAVAGAGAGRERLAELRIRRSGLRAELRASQGQFTEAVETGYASTQAIASEARRMGAELQGCEEACKEREVELQQIRRREAALAGRGGQLAEFRDAAEAEVAGLLEAAELRAAAAEAGGAAAAIAGRREAEQSQLARAVLAADRQAEVEAVALTKQAEALRSELPVLEAVQASALAAWQAEERSAEALDGRVARAELREAAAERAECQALRSVDKSVLTEEVAQFDHAKQKHQELMTEASEHDAATRRALFWALAGAAFVDCGFRAAEVLGW